MTFEQLKYFVAAARFEHINRAAQSIPISASVVSNAVRELEAEFQSIFFSRDGRTIRITSDGSRFLELAQNLLCQADKINSELKQNPRPLTGHFRVGASQFLAAKVLGPAWAILQKGNPCLTADVFSQPTWSLVDGVLAGRLDFAIGFSPSQNPQLETIEIYSGVSKIVARKNHPIFKHKGKNLYKRLDQYPATMHMASDRIMSASPSPILHDLKLNPAITFSYDNDFVALESLRHSDNWAFMVDVAAAEFSAHLKPIPIPKKLESRYSICIFKNKASRMDNVIAEAYRTIEERIDRLWK